MTREKSAPKKIIHGKVAENWAHYHDYSPPLCISTHQNVKLSRIKTQVTTTKSNCKKGKQQSSSLKVKGVAIEVERVGGNV